MRALLLALLLATFAWGQVTSTSVFDDFSLNNRTHTGSTSYVFPGTSNPGCFGPLVTTNKIWSAVCGGNNISFPYQAITFSGGKMVLDTRIALAGYAPKTITNVYSWGGTVAVTVPNGDINFVDGVGPVTAMPVKITGVTCTGGAAGCGANGYHLAHPFEYDFSSGMTGTNTVHITGHPFSNGANVYLANCAIQNVPMNLHKYVVANVTSNTFDLTGYSGALCGSQGQIYDNDHALMPSADFSGTYSSGGTLTIENAGFNIVASAGNKNSGIGGAPDFIPKGNMMGSWDDNYARMHFTVQCDSSVDFNHNQTIAVGPNGFNVGWYTKSDTTNNSSLQGKHFYHNFFGNGYANRDRHFWVTRRPGNTNDHSGSWEFPDDFTYYAQSIGGGSYHYFAGAVEWYLEQYASSFPDSRWPTGDVCKVGPFIMEAVSNETLSYFADIEATHNGTEYEIAFSSPELVPGGTTYDVSCGTTSRHTAGFTANCGSSISTFSPNTRSRDTYWKRTMAEASTEYVAFRPHMRVMSVNSVVSPNLVSPYMGFNLADGDHVDVAGLSSQGISDGNYAITNYPSQRFSAIAGTLTDVTVAAGSGTCIPLCATATLAGGATTSGLLKGQQLIIMQSASSNLDTFPDTNRSFVDSVVDSTHFKYGTWASAASISPIPSGCTGSSGDGSCMTISTFPAITLNGTSGGGSVTTLLASGTVTSTESTSGFGEIAIPATATSGVAPTITTASLAAGTVGVAYSQTLTATGDTPITWTVTTGSIPAWASLNASTGAITGTPNAAATTNFTVTAANGTAPNDTKALSITIAAAVTAKGSRSGVRLSGIRQ